MRVPPWQKFGFKNRTAARRANPAGYRAAEYLYRLGENPPPKGQRQALRGHKPSSLGFGIGGGHKLQDLLHAIKAAKSHRMRLVAEVIVPVGVFNKAAYKAGDARNMAKIAEAVEHDKDDATVWIGGVYTRTVALRRVQKAIASKESWVDLWSALLNTEILEVLQWYVVPI